MGSNSLPLKTMTVIVPFRKITNKLGGSYAYFSNSITLETRKIITHNAIVSYALADGRKYSFPMVGGTEPGGTIINFQEFGRGAYTLIEQSSGAMNINARFQDCDLCDKDAKFILHVVYTDMPLF